MSSAARNTAWIAILVVLSALIPLPARADLRWDTELTYRPDVGEEVLAVESLIEITNLTPDKRQGNRITSYYYDEIGIYIPEEAQEVVVTSGSGELAVTLEEPDDEEAEHLLLAEIELGRRLLYKQKMEILVRYTIPSDPPRSESFFRVNEAYINFPVIGWGEPGRVTVNVVTPIEFEVETFGADWSSSRRDSGDSIITFDEIQEPEDFFVVVTGWNDYALNSQTVDVEDVNIVIRSWPNDGEWVGEVEDAVKQGFPELRQLIGLDWITERPLLITESHEVTISGYAGWYLDDRDVVYIGEFVDPHLVLHELSHAWFDDGLFTERWILEGLAEEFSTRAAAESGLGDESDWRISRAPNPNRGFGKLHDWRSPADIIESMTPEELEAYEGYGYEASFWVIQEIVDEIGAEAMARVIEAADTDQIAYQGEPEPEPVEPEDGWRRFLDLVQEIGGSTNAESLIERYVTGEDLTERRTVRAEYAELETDGGDWDPPLYVRERMAEWDFEGASQRIDSAREVLAKRTEIEQRFEELDLVVLDSLQLAYETAESDLGVAQALADELLDAGERVLEARRELERERSFAMQVGLIGEDMAAEYQDSLEALQMEDFDGVARETDEILGLLDGAEDEGIRRVFIVTGSAVVLLGMVGFFIHRRRTRGRHQTGEQMVTARYSDRRKYS